ncbi:hypothetical protein CEP52_007037 [Fusarium oligoseptatum]|uniref:Uncharacterized protein n=1 Tax=Fusarium oligoseptatum TaxID=2604345 RepID=A0A428TPZ5_9HYPO|nr:hypothetical protein CEP52_007037 [Fusarium oligoseptatum]
MYTLNPTHEPETFFERLDLDPTAAPGPSKKKRLMSHDVEEEDKLLDAVVAMLLDRHLASVYMSMVLPKVQDTHGQARLDAFKAICETVWTGSAEEEEKAGVQRKHGFYLEATDDKESD